MRYEANTVKDFIKLSYSSTDAQVIVLKSDINIFFLNLH